MTTNRPQKGYIDFTTSLNVEVRLYPVPQHVLAGLKSDKPKPTRPTIEMQIKGGTQRRWIKAGDDGWDEYQEELEAWDKERDELEQAVTFVLALRDVKIPDPITFPKDIQELAADGLLEIPDNKWLRKFMWLRLNVVGQHDEFEILTYIQELSGVPREVTDQMRQNFRDILSGKKSGAVGEGAAEPA